MQTHSEPTYEIDLEAPCALCGSPSPQNKMDITIDKPQTWGVGYDKFTFRDLPICDVCKIRRERASMKFLVFLGLSVFPCVIGLFATDDLQALFVVGLIICGIGAVSWRSYNRNAFKKIEAWAEKYVQLVGG